MRSGAQRWSVGAVASIGGLAAVLTFMISASSAGEPHVPSNNARPPDALTERLERPRSEQDPVRRSPLQVQLTQSEVVRLAKTAAKQTLGAACQAYDLKGVMFDQQTRLWVVTITQGTSPFSPNACLIVLSNDGSREATSRSCR